MIDHIIGYGYIRTDKLKKKLYELAGYIYDIDDYVQVVEKSKEKFFTLVGLADMLPDEFKKNFLYKYYDRRISYIKWSDFYRRLYYTLVVRDHTLIKNMEYFKKMEISDQLVTTDMSQHSIGENQSNEKTNANSETADKTIASNTPQEKLDIIWPGTEGKVIEYADSLGENYGKTAQESTQHNNVNSETNNNMYGYSGSSKGLQLADISAYRNIEEIALERCDRLFMSVYSYDDMID